MIVIPVGIIYNLSSPGRLPFIGQETTVDYSKSDSLMNTLRIQDSLQRIADSLKQSSTHRADSLKLAEEKRVQDSLHNVLKQDSLKHVNDSLKAVKQRIQDSIKNAKNEQDFAKPVDIRLDFAKAMFDRQYQFIDARDESDFRAGTIKGAMNIPYHKLDDFKPKLENMAKDKAYVVFCSSSCDVSIDLAYAMAHMGFSKVYIFHGGWDEWKNAGYPVQ